MLFAQNFQVRKSSKSEWSNTTLFWNLLPVCLSIKADKNGYGTELLVSLEFLRWAICEENLFDVLEGVV